jgi:dihydrofolate reductase
MRRLHIHHRRNPRCHRPGARRRWRKDILIAGGLSIAQQALAEGLVDELSMHITPVLIGSGRDCSTT